MRLKKKGNYKSALKLFLTISKDKYSEKDYLYARRSVAACYYYLKEYHCALKEFKTILNDFFCG